MSKRRQDKAGAGEIIEATDPVGIESVVEGWFGSIERQRALTQLVMLIAASVALAAIGAVVFFVHGLIPANSTRIFLAVACWCAALFFYAFGLARVLASRAQFREGQERRLQAERQQALEQLQDVTDLATLLKLNRQQMDAYQTLSRDQASSSYAVSQIASVTGGFILLTGAIAVVVVPAAATKISVAALSALGGAFSGYISRTFLRVYERTLIQLNFYFQQPLISSYVLTAERLVSKMAQRRQDAAHARVVDNVLAITGRAAHGAAEEATATPAGSGGATSNANGQPSIPSADHEAPVSSLRARFRRHRARQQENRQSD